MAAQKQTTHDPFKPAPEAVEKHIDPAKLTMKRKLTMDATSIQRLGQVVCRIDGELEEIEMPPVTKDGPPSKATGVPITDVIANKSYLLICNAIIVSALRRAQTYGPEYGKLYQPTPDQPALVKLQPLTGRYFALRAGEIKAGRRYRQVDVIELELAPE